MRKRLLPEFVNRPIKILIRVWHVIEAPSQGIVVAYCSPIDAHRRVDGGLDILGLDLASAGPAGIDCIGAGGVGDAEGLAAGDSRACEEGELLREVVAAFSGGDGSDGAR